MHVYFWILNSEKHLFFIFLTIFYFMANFLF
ncbi:hypothetical protein TSAR_013505 [Trichomalopsis sarcophagae]|uniref:Uncharacterized protein n=1 Tax=Trichomalopsis sarcophagae TaxID=543379 RepID=A0A232EYS4_9HYME|nr:hypothetical protein TSAR_013505 [Trichomalopsis sarcophagae]